MLEFQVDSNPTRLLTEWDRRRATVYFVIHNRKKEYDNEQRK
jgi:hypothetical protein